MVCHYVSDVSDSGEKIKILIPGCWGSTIHGKHRCTCGSRTKRKNFIQRLETKVSDLEAKISELEEMLKIRK